jgi:phage-related protein
MLAYMGERFDVLELEVQRWLDTLPIPAYRTVEYHADRVAASPTTLGEPYSKHLQGAVRELRFHLGRAAWRITYWLAPQRRIVLLTVFRKTRTGRRARSSAPSPPRRCAKPSIGQRLISTTVKGPDDEGVPHQVDYSR